MEKNSTKRKFRFTIGRKISIGFLSLIFLTVVMVLVIFWKGRVIDKSVQFSSDNARPSKEAVNKFILMVTQSKMYITNWVYLQANKEDKDKLVQIIDNDYPALKMEIGKLTPNWSEPDRRNMDTVFINFENMIKAAKENVTEKLTSFENYEDGLTKLLAEDAVESQVIPMSTDLIKRLDALIERQNAVTETSDAEITDATKQLYYFTFSLGGFIVLLSIIAAVIIVRSITVPINYIKEVIVKLGKGELVEDKNKKFGNDEIGEMATAMDNLVSGLRATTGFAENIGNGRYDSDFQPLSEHDVLGNALLNMRGNLSRVADEDKKRNWATEGMAKFGEILRTNNNDVRKLSDEIIANLIKYLKANQGALYIIDDTDNEEPTMSMTACYAWDKKKFLNQKIYRGEGLAGQSWQEMDTIFLTDVPQNYIRITSGLGDANPSCILIVPLKVNDQIFGVVEIASFNVLKDHEVDFVKKISESIASTISTVKINERTTKLLEESQQMTEEMRAQEEEMRQNMEELQATQEGMNRVVKEAQDKEAYLTNLINSSTDSIFAIDRQYKLVISNEVFDRAVSASGVKVTKGLDMLSIDPESRKIYDRALRGENFELEQEYAGRRYRLSYNPLRDYSGATIGLAVFSRDITESK
ncbi:MAG: histidine kinase [Azospira oryzae]|jgi:methyl-accepting chemotaxis protein|nr:MAG: histidine kinase [Azospira oryzae]